MLLYLFGNWCCILAALILLYHYYLKRPLKADDLASFDHQSGMDTPTTKDIMVSRDLQIMLLIGTFARVYWSCSPRPVWDEEELFIQYLSISDVFISPVVWTVIVILIGIRQKKYNRVPPHFSWPALTIGAMILGYFGSKFLPPLDTEESWPGADIMVMFNMILDGFAMVPQMYLIAHSEDKASSEASHFVGLLCLGRVFRMMFWATLLVAQIMSGDNHGHYIWTFIIPDVVHTVIMGDYLYLWLKKVKRDQIEPMMQSAYGAVSV